jgi:hypothetical protein
VCLESDNDVAHALGLDSTVRIHFSLTKDGERSEANDKQAELKSLLKALLKVLQLKDLDEKQPVTSTPPHSSLFQPEPVQSAVTIQSNSIHPFPHQPALLQNENSHLNSNQVIDSTNSHHQNMLPIATNLPPQPHISSNPPLSNQQMMHHHQHVPIQSTSQLMNTQPMLPNMPKQPFIPQNEQYKLHPQYTGNQRDPQYEQMNYQSYQYKTPAAQYGTNPLPPPKQFR